MGGEVLAASPGVTLGPTAGLLGCLAGEIYSLIAPRLEPRGGGDPIKRPAPSPPPIGDPVVPPPQRDDGLYAYYRMVGDAEATLTRTSGLAQPSGTSFGVPATRVFGAASWPGMSDYAALANANAAQSGVAPPYTNVVAYLTRYRIPPWAPDASTPTFTTFYLRTGDLNAALAGPPIVTPLAQFSP